MGKITFNSLRVEQDNKHPLGSRFQEATVPGKKKKQSEWILIHTKRNRSICDSFRLMYAAWRGLARRVIFPGILITIE